MLTKAPVPQTIEHYIGRIKGFGLKYKGNTHTDYKKCVHLMYCKSLMILMSTKALL